MTEFGDVAPNVIFEQRIANVRPLHSQAMWRAASSASGDGWLSTPELPFDYGLSSWADPLHVGDADRVLALSSPATITGLTTMLSPVRGAALELLDLVWDDIARLHALLPDAQALNLYCSTETRGTFWFADPARIPSRRPVAGVRAMLADPAAC